MSWLVKNFLGRGVNAIIGKPGQFQAPLADEIAFQIAARRPVFGELEVCSTGDNHVVVLTDAADAYSAKLKTFHHHFGIEPPAVVKITVIDAANLTKERRNFSTAFFAALHQQKIVNPALIVSARAATSMGGFSSPEAVAEMAMAKKAVDFGFPVLLAGHTPQGRIGDLAEFFDAVWNVTANPSGLTFTQDAMIMKLTGRTIGGHGRVVTQIFDALPIAEKKSIAS